MIISKIKMFARASVLIGAVLIAWNARAQEETIGNEMAEEQVVIPPLFEYVVAPEDLPDLQSRTDYLMEHFWDPFDFKNTNVVDQNALNHAFGVYVQAMQYASDKKVEQSIKNLIGKIKNNPGLSYQFAKAAEENLYSPRAELWGDVVYLDFLKNVIDNKNVSDSRKKHFRHHWQLLTDNSPGSSFPPIILKNAEEVTKSFSPLKNFTLIELTSPENHDNYYTNLQLDISGIVNELIEEGRLEVMLVSLADSFPVGNFPSKWNVFYSPDAMEKLDIRITPGFYVLDRDGKIIAKNLQVDNAVDFLRALTNQ